MKNINLYFTVHDENDVEPVKKFVASNLGGTSKFMLHIPNSKSNDPCVLRMRGNAEITPVDFVDKLEVLLKLGVDVLTFACREETPEAKSDNDEAGRLLAIVQSQPQAKINACKHRYKDLVLQKKELESKLSGEEIKLIKESDKVPLTGRKLMSYKLEFQEIGNKMQGITNELHELLNPSVDTPASGVVSSKSSSSITESETSSSQSKSNKTLLSKIGGTVAKWAGMTSLKSSKSGEVVAEESTKTPKDNKKSDEMITQLKAQLSSKVAFSEKENEQQQQGAVKVPPPVPPRAPLSPIRESFKEGAPPNYTPPKPPKAGAKKEEETTLLHVNMSVKEAEARGLENCFVLHNNTLSLITKDGIKESLITSKLKMGRLNNMLEGLNDSPSKRFELQTEPHDSQSKYTLALKKSQFDVIKECTSTPEVFGPVSTAKITTAFKAKMPQEEKPKDDNEETLAK